MTRVLGEEVKVFTPEDDSPFNDGPTVSDPVAVAADPVQRAEAEDDTMSYFAKLAAEA